MTADTQAAAPAMPQDDGRKVFVGNLAFTVDDDSLSAYFSAVGPVDAAHVIRRGNRSLGYGFVTFASDEVAVQAQASLNKQLFGDREINVELAKTREEGAARPQRGGFRGGRRGGRGGYGYAGAADYAQEGEGYYNQGFRGGVRGRRHPRGGRTHAPREGTPSTTTLFVANLPYSMTEEGLTTLFGQFKVAKAHVVITKSGRSKGYGFIEFESEAEQKRALVEMNNAVVEERPLTVKVALNTQNPEDAEVSSA